MAKTQIEEQGKPMLRIKPEEVLAAYKKIGAEPWHGHINMFICVRDGKLRCCGMGALAEVAGVIDNHVERYLWADKVYSPRYALGFYHGFDSVEPNKNYLSLAEYSFGYEDGKAAAALCFKELA